MISSLTELWRQMQIQNQEMRELIATLHERCDLRKSTYLLLTILSNMYFVFVQCGQLGLHFGIVQI